MEIMRKNWLNIVLFEPEIPANTGNIGRMCVGLDIKLHLIEPMGFLINDKELKRAGLDYWPDLDVETYHNFDNFLDRNQHPQFYFASTKSTNSYFNVNFKTGDYIVFGRESAGLPAYFHDNYRKNGITIPMPGKVRSINLSNSAAIIAYEAYRQLFATGVN